MWSFRKSSGVQFANDRLNIHSTRSPFFRAVSVWSAVLRSRRIVTPKSLAEETIGTVHPWIRYSGVNGCRETISTADFRGLIGRWFSSDQFDRASKSDWNCSWSAWFLTHRQSFKSSANITQRHLMDCGRSCTKTVNSLGPRTAPCGTPLVAWTGVESSPLTHTCHVLPMM